MEKANETAEDFNRVAAQTAQEMADEALRIEKEVRQRLLVEQAAKRKFGVISAFEREQLAQYPEEQHPAILAFWAWSSKKKFKGGIQAKLIAKQTFIEAFEIARTVYYPDAVSEVEKKKSSLILPPGL